LQVKKEDFIKNERNKIGAGSNNDESAPIMYDVFKLI